MKPTPVYDQDGITLYHGDCREIVPHLGRFDLLLTDPPYGIKASGISERGGKQHGAAACPSRDYGDIEWDDTPIPSWLISMVIDWAESAIVFGGNYYQLPATSCWLVWDKENGANDYADCELAWTNLKKAVRRFKWRWQGMLQEQMGDKKEFRVHPTQKPVPLMQWCLSHAPDAKRVLDPFGGSGTTAVACKLEGRECVLIEREAKYVEATIDRLSQKVLAFE